MTIVRPLSILVLGAAYGMLPGLKLAMAGHKVTLVGRRDEIAKMAEHDLVLHLPLRRSGERISLRACVAAEAAPMAPALCTPDAASPEIADFVILAMQEPQFAAAEIVDLMTRIGRARRPCLSIMNLPPPPFLERLGLAIPAIVEGVYSSDAAWKAIDPALITLASPDAQAVRLQADAPGEVTVTLASNFKAAPFRETAAQGILARLAHDMSRLKGEGALASTRPPVALIATSSLRVPLAKWPMLIAGNSRCLFDGGSRSIAEAVFADITATRVVYQLVTDLIRKLGTPEGDVVPFDAYAKAAAHLARPSSLARALMSGATAVERIDRLVLNLLRYVDHDVTLVEAISEQIDGALAINHGA